MAKNRAYYLVNGITTFRILAAPVLVICIFTERADLFKWILAFSFFTDLIDGTIARKFNATSIFGAWLDSIADDLTIVAAIIGLFYLKLDFIKSELGIIIPL